MASTTVRTAVRHELFVMVRDTYFDELDLGAVDEEANNGNAAHVAVVDEIDAWFAEACCGGDAGVSEDEPHHVDELIGAAALPPHSELVRRGRRRPARGGSGVMRGHARVRRRGRGQPRRARPLALSALVVGALLLAAIVLLPAGSTVPDGAARRGPVSSVPTVPPAEVRLKHQLRERAQAGRAARKLVRLQAAARERRAAARRADRRRAVEHDRAVRVRTQPPARTVPVVAAPKAQANGRIPDVRPRESPAATGEFEP